MLVSHFRYFAVERCEVHDRLTGCYDHLVSDDLKSQDEVEEVVVLELFAGQPFD